MLARRHVFTLCITVFVAVALALPASAQPPDDRLIETIAGNFNGDGRLATELPLFPTGGILVEPDGSLLINDETSLYRIDVATWRATRIAGQRSSSSTGDGGPATLASYLSFVNFARDSQGHIYIADGNRRIRKIDTNGTITTVAGNGTFGYSGDGGPATEAQFGFPTGIAINGLDEIFFSDDAHEVIRKVDTNGIISTVAGDGTCGSSGDGGPAAAAQLCGPWDIKFDSVGNLIIGDTFNLAVRKIDTNGTITTVADSAFPIALAIGPEDEIYVTGFGTVDRIDGNGVVETVAGDGTGGYGGDGGPATEAQLGYVSGLRIDNQGRLLICDESNFRVRRVDGGVIETIAGTGQDFYGEGLSALVAKIWPWGMTLDDSGNLFFADRINSAIRQIDEHGILTTVAGTGVPGSGGDGGPALAAQFNFPYDVALGSDGALYVADSSNYTVRKIHEGVVTTVAGNGTRGYSGDGGPATAAQLSFPTSISVADDGTIYIADRNNEVVRVVSPGGTIDTFAGNGVRGFSGDGGPATAASLSRPSGVAVDGVGNVYIADASNDRVRRVDGDGTIITYVSVLFGPHEVSVSPDGSLLVAGGNRVVRIDEIAGEGIVVTEIAGGDNSGFSGDGGLAIDATLSGPWDAILAPDDNVYISDFGNRRIRRVFTFEAEEQQIELLAVAEEAQGLAGDALTGTSVAGLGDLDGDGLDDFIAGAPGYQEPGGPAEVGAAAVYFGSTEQAERETPDIVFVGDAAHDRAGVSVAGGFDFNGDGQPDLLIGAEQTNRTDPDNPVAVGAGKAYLIYFDPTDVVHYPNLANPLLEDRVDLALVGQPGGISGVVLTGESLGDRAGFAVAGGGRIDPGNGPEIAIGAPGRDTAGGVDAGTVYVVFDDPALSGVVGLPRVANGLADQVDGIVYLGAAAGDMLGFSVAFPGDVVEPDGDDIVMGAPLADTEDGLRTLNSDTGRTYVGSGGDQPSAIIEVSEIGEEGEEGEGGAQLYGYQSGEQSGFAVAGGGDNLINGKTDLLIGAPHYDTVTGEDAGRVLQTAGRLPQGIFSIESIGADGPEAVPGVQYHGDAAGDALGFFVAGVGDVTGDLTDDVIFGAPFSDPNGVPDAGTVYVVEGRVPDGETIIPVDQIGETIAGRILIGDEEGQHAGSAGAGTGDLDGNGTRDFIVGSPGRDLPEENDAGAVGMVLETADLVVESRGQPDCVDDDGDGYGEGPLCLGPDCDDQNPDANPEQREICGNGFDDDCNGLIDDDEPECEPLLAVLESLTAELTPKGVLVEWRTVLEIDNLGFRVLRGTESVAELTTLTDELIPARGSELSGAEYRYFDGVRQTVGSTLYYYLEDVDRTGKVTRHGPVILVVDRPVVGAAAPDARGKPQRRVGR